MGFQYKEFGSREAVIKHLKEFKELAPDGKTVAKDQSQVEAAKALAISEINALPAEFAGAHVIIEGFAHAGGRNVSVQVIPQKLRL